MPCFESCAMAMGQPLVTLVSIIPSPQLLATTNLWSVSIDSPILSFIYMESHKMWPSVSALLTQYNVFGDHLCCSLYQYFIPFYHWMISIRLFVYAISSWWVSWVVSTFWLWNNVSLNVCVHVFVSVPAFSSWGLNLGGELLSHMIILYLTM